MPKNKSDTKSSSGIYEVKFINAKPGTSFALYLDGRARRIYQGRAQEEEFSIFIPNNLKGKGQLHFTIPRTSRAVFSKSYTIDIKLQDGAKFDLEHFVEKEKAKASEDEGALENDLREEVQERKKGKVEVKTTLEETPPKKKFLFNKLGELVRAREEKVATSAS